MTQPQEALVYASEIRSARTRVAQQVRDGELSLRAALDVPEVQGARIHTFVARALYSGGRRHGEIRVTKVLQEMGYYRQLDKIVADLPVSRRDEFCELIALKCVLSTAYRNQRRSS